MVSKNGRWVAGRKELLHEVFPPGGGRRCADVGAGVAAAAAAAAGTGAADAAVVVEVKAAAAAVRSWVEP